MSNQVASDKLTKSEQRTKKVAHFVSEYGILLALLLMVVILTMLSPNFLTSSNLLNLFRQVSINAVLAIGMTFVILTKGIDLSVGSILALSGIVAASLSVGPDSNLLLGIIAGLAVGLLFGAINGVVVSKFKVTPFIATLGMMAIARGFTYIYSDGQPISGLSEPFLAIGSGSFLGMPIPVWIVIIAFIICSIVLYKTKFGRYVYAVGGNENATLTSGISVNKTLMSVYCISGLLAGLAGVILASRVSSGLPQAGVSYELDAIAAVVIGGTSLMGGRGRLWGTLVGALIIGVLNNGLDLLAVSSYWQQVIKGTIIIIAVLVDRKRS
ncbi:ribose ABC transporter permease [Bacillaceae bacterium SIJ1]|uniref:ABC transporter permease n=1 Tax=Litoribacterium kuwaitense TaxID=1398745 RepID=UPI0013ED9857|nr:ribose ABC transporter permease [Litoribacterium kuwaitense]NGP46385.1 ribose ABC transporter permease [Litoribacterium kuwaitense]